MKKKKGVVVFLVMIIAMLLLGYYSYGIVKGTAAKDNEKGIKLGLDLAGGVSITYQVKGDETPSAEDMKDTVYKLQKRVETYSCLLYTSCGKQRHAWPLCGKYCSQQM